MCLLVCSSWPSLSRSAHLVCAWGLGLMSLGPHVLMLVGPSHSVSSRISCSEACSVWSFVGCELRLCRVIGGNVRYTDEIAPDPHEMAQSCMEGEYDSVLGPDACATISSWALGLQQEATIWRCLSSHSSGLASCLSAYVVTLMAPKLQEPCKASLSWRH